MMVVFLVMEEIILNEIKTPLSVKSNVKDLIQHPRNKYFKAIKTNGEIIKWH